MTEPWTTSIEFTVTPTDDPDVVNVTDGGPTFPIGRDYTADENDAYAQAARAYFDAHPPKPAHPLADAKVGEWWHLEFPNGDTSVVKIKDYTASFVGGGLVSARQVYVIPKAEFDRVATSAREGFATPQGAVAAILAEAL